MNAATELASLVGLLDPLPATASAHGIAVRSDSEPRRAFGRRLCSGGLVSDKKTIQGKVHFVLPERIGSVRVMSGVDESMCSTRFRLRSHERREPARRRERAGSGGMGARHVRPCRAALRSAESLLSFNIDKHWRSERSSACSRSSIARTLRCSTCAAEPGI